MGQCLRVGCVDWGTGPVYETRVPELLSWDSILVCRFRSLAPCRLSLLSCAVDTHYQEHGQVGRVFMQPCDSLAHGCMRQERLRRFHAGKCRQQAARGSFSGRLLTMQSLSYTIKVAGSAGLIRARTARNPSGVKLHQCQKHRRMKAGDDGQAGRP